MPPMDVPPTDVAGLEAWPALIPTLCQALDNQDNSLVDGALAALHKICEARVRANRIAHARWPMCGVARTVR